MRFYVNVDHVATVRQARRTDEPDPVTAAHACEKGGADGITIHLREDRRHIQDDDVRRIADSISTVLNLELAVVDDVVALAEELAPHQATFVPERREEVTTEGGLALSPDGGASEARLAGAIDRLQAAGVRVSLFIDPDPRVIDASAAVGADAVELHTGDYAHSFPDCEAALQRLRAAAAHGRSVGLAVHAGHGLTYRNVKPVAAIPEVEELNIGHSIVSRSIYVGIETAVSEMRRLIEESRVD
jgi:pyridoxine 5-phosphate synthase